MKILLFNRNEQYIATLRDVLSAKHTEELNGENVLEIRTLDEIEKNQSLIYKDKYGYWHEFIVRGVEEERAEAGIIRRVFAEHSFYETWGDYVEDKRPYNVPANIALESALGTTRWEVGIVDDLGIGSTNFYHISAKEAVQKVAETWQGELRYRIEVSGNRITGRYVDLLARRGYDLGKRFAYTKDLISITKTVHRDDVITALYGYGKGQEIVDEEGQPTGGFGRRIDFADINGGKAYVENLEAKEIWGRLNPDGTRSHVFGKVEFDDCEDPHELLELTKEKLKELSQPHITYEAKVIDLKALGIEHEGVELGDTVGIIDNEFKPPLRLKARVIKMVRDLLEPENTEIVLGNFIPTITDTWLEQEKFISNFRGKQGVWDRSKIINDDGTIDSQFLKNLVDELNTRMNALGGYVYLSEDGKGLITYDKPIDQNPTMAIQLLGGAFRIANSKLPNGEWNWRTFGDGNGFVADAFIGGLLKGGKVHFDLTNGTLLIGNSIEDYRLFFDGNNLSIRLSHGKTIEESIDEIEVGGRNLLLNSSVEMSRTGLNAHFGYPFNANDIDEGTLLTISFDAKSNLDNFPMDCYFRSGATNNLPQPVIYVSTVYQRYSIQMIVPSWKDSIETMHFRPRGDGTLFIRNVKIEKGNKATDWTPAPEDVDEAISTVDTKYSNKVAEINTTIDGITQRVESTETNITTINGKIAAHNTRIESAESKITPSAIVQTVRQSTAYINDLAAKGDKSVLDSVVSTISQHANQIALKVEQTDIDRAVSEIEIGGRNLLRNSGNFSSTEGWTGNPAIVVKDGVSVLEVPGGSTNNSGANIKLDPKTTYTYSGIIAFDKDINGGDINSTVPLHCHTRYGGSNTAGRKSIKLLSSHEGLIPAGTWINIVIELKTRDDDELGDIIFSPYIYGPAFTDVTYWIKNIKLEKGNKATDWTPAPEDIDQAINTVETRIQTAEQKITPTAIVSTVRQSTAYQNDLDGKVSKNNIISEINQTAETIKIQASKIKLEGLVTANSNFKILTDGSIEAKNADISGKITATSGSIGGWQLTSSLIQYRPDSSNNNSRFYFDSSPTGTYRIASYNSSGSRMFSVSKTGVLYARNADIAGKITASSGKIGGWNIASGYIDTKDGNARMFLASHADSASYYIYASDSSGNRMFSVSKTGVLYATGADITGKITATSGSFPASLITGALTANQINVSTLSAISANLGTITAGNITGVTITGGTVRTGSGNNRIELSSNLLRSYSGGVRRVQLDYDSLDFYTADGASAGDLVAIPSTEYESAELAIRGKELASISGGNSSTFGRVLAGSDGEETFAFLQVQDGSIYNRTQLIVSPSVVQWGHVGCSTYASGDFTVINGTKAATVQTDTYGLRKLYALETPDCRFVTYMEMELETGEHYIEIEPMFRQTISDYFVVPHIQNMAEVSILERGEKGFRVLVGEKKAEVVFEINGIRKGYEGVYMEEVKHDLKGRMSKHEN